MSLRSGPASEVLIKKCCVEDLPAIFQLVKELANYEKAPLEVTATLDDYQKAYKDGVFDATIAQVNDEIVGTAIYYLTWSTWKGRMLYLEDFVVKSDHRKAGIGQLLFDAYLEVAKDMGCTMVKWQVLDWNQQAINFYEKNDAIIEKGWWNGKIIFDKIPAPEN